MMCLRFGLKNLWDTIRKVNRYIGLLSDLGQKEKSLTYVNERVAPYWGFAAKVLR